VKAVVAAVALMLFAFSCAGAQRNATDPRKNEITALWTQIRDWRREANLPVEPRREDVNSIRFTPVKEVQRVCPEGHNVPETCNDVCSIADAICDNAESICILADELGKKDTWAQDKCASAKASCRDAKKKCCGCSEDKATEKSTP
jgi:hypothetical protein